MRRAYRIDLGFDHRPGSPACRSQRRAPTRPCAGARRVDVAPARGTPGRTGCRWSSPFAELGAPLGLAETEVLATLRDWCERGWRCAGWASGAAPPRVRHRGERDDGLRRDRGRDRRDARGSRPSPASRCAIAARGAARLALHLYCMVHGGNATPCCACRRRHPRRRPSGRPPRETLFSTRRFKADRCALLCRSGDRRERSGPPGTIVAPPPAGGAAGSPRPTRVADPPAARRRLSAQRAAVRRHRRR